jgi:hypothetical protein
MPSLEDTIAERAEDSGLFAIAWALLGVKYELKMLGNADAATPMGALEALGAVLKEGQEALSSSVAGAGEEIARALLTQPRGDRQ